VPGIGLREREALLQRRIALRHTAGVVERLTGVAAVADHVESPIPPGRQAHFKSDLRSQQSGDLAVRRYSRGGRLRYRCDLHNVFRLVPSHRIARLARLDVGLRIIHPRHFQVCEHLGLTGNCRRSHEDGGSDTPDYCPAVRGVLSWHVSLLDSAVWIRMSILNAGVD
jgi:hypothetical protein